MAIGHPQFAKLQDFGDGDYYLCYGGETKSNPTSHKILLPRIRTKSYFLGFAQYFVGSAQNLTS